MKIDVVSIDSNRFDGGHICDECYLWYCRVSKRYHVSCRSDEE